MPRVKLRVLIWLVLGLASVISGCAQKPDNSRIYFVARTVPGANIFSVNMQQDLLRHTNNSGSRDTDMTLDKQGNLYFTSNRVLAEDRAKRAEIGKRGNRRQDLNVYHLPAGTVEETLNGAAEPIDKTEMPESLAVISPAGNQFVYVRTQLPEARPSGSIASIQSQTHDELYWKPNVTGEAVKIYQDGVIVKPNWSTDGQQLVFSTYSFKDKRAKLMRFDVATREVKTLLENPFGVNQIDSPQWSPNGQMISLILHPLERKKLRALYVYNLAENSLTEISAIDHSVEPYIAWAQDSQQIIYSAAVDTGDFAVMAPRPSDDTQVHIFAVNLQGDVRQISSGEGVFSSPALSPDNQRIAYQFTEKYRQRSAQLKVMDLEGANLGMLHDAVYRRGRLIWQ